MCFEYLAWFLANPTREPVYARYKYQPSVLLQHFGVGVHAGVRAATRTMPLLSPDVSPRSTAGVLRDGHRSWRHVMSVCDWQPVEYVAMCYALASICNSPLEYLRDIVDSAAIVL